MVEMSNFSFSHNVFKRLVLQTHEDQGLFGKGLTVFLIATYNGITLLYNRNPEYKRPLEKKALENIGNQSFFFSHNVVYS